MLRLLVSVVCTVLNGFIQISLTMTVSLLPPHVTQERSL